VAEKLREVEMSRANTIRVLGAQMHLDIRDFSIADTFRACERGAAMQTGEDVPHER
jgi:hypothetical protein